MNIDLLSHRSENHLVKMLVSSVDYSATEGTPTKKGGLNASETAGCLSNMHRAPFLCLMVYTDLMVIQKDLTELQALIVTWCQTQNWYDTDLMHMDRRAQGLAVNAILDLTPNDKQRTTTKQKAVNLGISTQAFNKKWHAHQEAVNRQTHQWLVEAAQSLHRQTAFNELTK